MLKKVPTFLNQQLAALHEHLCTKLLKFTCFRRKKCVSEHRSNLQFKSRDFFKLPSAKYTALTRTTHQNTEIMLFLPYIWGKEKRSAFEIWQGTQWVWEHGFAHFRNKNVNYNCLCKQLAHACISQVSDRLIVYNLNILTSLLHLKSSRHW